MPNRYKNTSHVTQIFFDLQSGQTITMYPGGYAVSEPNTALSRSRFTTLVEKNVEVQQFDNFEDQEDLEDEGYKAQLQGVKPPRHSNQNPTNTVQPEADGLNDTILTDEFDGADDTGAVNTSAADHLKGGDVAEAAAKAAEQKREETRKAATGSKESTKASTSRGK